MSGTAGRILFDVTQNERGRISTTYKALAKLLRDHGYVVEEYNEFLILPDKISKADVIVFACPNGSKLRTAEINTLRHFVEHGGNLLLLSHAGGDRGLMSNLGVLGDTFGIRFDNTQVIDDRNNLNIKTIPIISDIKDHPIVRNVSRIAYPAGCSLIVERNARGIIFTSETAEPNRAPVLAISKLGKGKVVAMGSYEIFRDDVNGGIDAEDNEKLALGIFEWLTSKEEDEYLSARPATPTISTIRPVRQPRQAAKQSHDTINMEEMKNILARLINLVFDLSKQIDVVSKKVSKVEKDVLDFKRVFVNFAQSMNQQIGVVIPQTTISGEATSRASLERKLKALNAEKKSITDMLAYIERRVVKGAISQEEYKNQTSVLKEKLKGINVKIKEIQAQLEKLETKSKNQSSHEASHEASRDTSNEEINEQEQNSNSSEENSKSDNSKESKNSDDLDETQQNSTT